MARQLVQLVGCIVVGCIEICYGCLCLPIDIGPHDVLEALNAWVDDNVDSITTNLMRHSGSKNSPPADVTGIGEQSLFLCDVGWCVKMTEGYGKRCQNTLYAKSSVSMIKVSRTQQ